MKKAKKKGDKPPKKANKPEGSRKQESNKNENATGETNEDTASA